MHQSAGRYKPVPTGLWDALRGRRGVGAGLGRGAVGGRAASPAGPAQDFSDWPISRDHHNGPRTTAGQLNKAISMFESFPGDNEVHSEKGATGPAVTAGWGAPLGKGVSGLPHTSHVRPCKSPGNQGTRCRAWASVPSPKGGGVPAKLRVSGGRGGPCCSDVPESNGRGEERRPLGFASSLPNKTPPPCTPTTLTL